MIPVNGPLLSKNAGSAPPEDGMHIDDVNDRFSEFGVLTGWEGDA